MRTEIRKRREESRGELGMVVLWGRIERGRKMGKKGDRRI